MSDITIIHTRTKNSDISCLGEFTFNDHLYYTLEDPVREKKIKGITAIPYGLYEIKINENFTPLTKKYRGKYDWFEYHLEIQNVENYTNVYQHIGNFATDSEGCQLIGLSKGVDFVGSSRKAFERYYRDIYPILKKGEQKVFISIEECFES